jgi:signal transduction histidine kinase
LARAGRTRGAFVASTRAATMHEGAMSVSVVVAGADPERRNLLVAALLRAGLRVTEHGEAGDVRVDDPGDAIELSDGVSTSRLSRAIAPDDLAAAAVLAVELATLRAQVRDLEDAHPVGLIAAMVAHDARNVILSMQFTADALLALEDPTTTHFAHVLIDGCRRITAMLRRLAKPRAGGPQRLDVNTVVNDLAPTLLGVLGDQARLVTRLESPLPPIWVDPGDLERALVNLIANARDASPPGERVVLSTAMRSVDDARWVVVEVADDGAGMDEATRARACEPFFTTKADRGGSGLGLSSVARAMKTAHGKLELVSEPDQGTRVRLWFPAA